MAVIKFNLTLQSESPKTLRADWGHAGVVSSGDLEVLIQKNKKNDHATYFNVNTKAAGFEKVWQNVLTRFVQRSGLAAVTVDINDNAATPPVVIRRIEQAIHNGGGLIS